MKKLTYPILFLLAGCASTEVLTSSPKTIVVKADRNNADEAQIAADRECAKHGKSAYLNQSVPANKVWASFFFDCK